ncbi:MAG: LapA family protein [Burkholderiales bacterium]|jgi:putative membrane protein|nr:LapA family protein [Burkholderiales bacterium]MBP7522712.1 LapA family protein [Leptothrix sp. (in: b-proteobacteria)]
MRFLTWLFRAAVFFVLFAFALNNQHEAQLHWFFGWVTRTPMVFVVLGAFASGCVVGALAMLPSWWRLRRQARENAESPAAAAVEESAPVTRPVPLPDIDLNAARRDGI